MNSRQYHMLREKKKVIGNNDLRLRNNRTKSKWCPFELDELLPMIKGEPIICKHFGCGKVLSPEEQLYGGRCVDHSHEMEINQSLVACSMFS